MAYKLKPHKGMAKRFKVSATGKVSHRHEKSTHLRSGRSAKLKRHLGRPSVLAEGMARNVRRYLGLKKLKPLQVEHERALEAKQPEREQQQQQARSSRQSTSSRREPGQPSRPTRARVARDS